MTYWHLVGKPKLKTEDEVFEEYGIKNKITEIKQDGDGYKVKGTMTLKPSAPKFNKDFINKLNS